jgi:hypothetical protein
MNISTTANFGIFVSYTIPFSTLMDGHPVRQIDAIIINYIESIQAAVL